MAHFLLREIQRNHTGAGGSVGAHSYEIGFCPQVSVYIFKIYFHKLH